MSDYAVTDETLANWIRRASAMEQACETHGLALHEAAVAVHPCELALVAGELLRRRRAERQANEPQAAGVDEA